MKALLLFILLLSGTYAFGQTIVSSKCDIPVRDEREEYMGKKDSRDTSVYQLVEQMPEYPGGEGALIKFLMANIHYPDSISDTQNTKTVLRLVVNESGNISDITVIRSMGQQIDDEIKRVVMMLKFKPGMHKGKLVKVALVIPFRIELRKN